MRPSQSLSEKSAPNRDSSRIPWKFFKHFRIFCSSNLIILFIGKANKKMYLVAKHDFFQNLTLNLWIFQNPIFEHLTTCTILWSTEPWKRINANLSSKFIEGNFWKYLIVDCDDGLMWKNFLCDVHLHRLWFH